MINSGNNLVGTIEALAALLVVFLAYLIKYKKQFNIIAGYDEKTVKDKDGLGNWIGGVLIITGSIACLLAVLVIILPKYAGIIMAVYVITFFTGTITAVIGGSKFKT